MNLAERSLIIIPDPSSSSSSSWGRGGGREGEGVEEEEVEASLFVPNLLFKKLLNKIVKTLENRKNRGHVLRVVHSE